MTSVEEKANKIAKEVDFIVVGAGIIGLSLALGLLKQGYRIALIADRLPTLLAHEQDLQVISLNHQSISILKDLGGWTTDYDKKANYYNELSTWGVSVDKLEFKALDLGLEYLGAMIRTNELTQTLLEQCQTFSTFSLYVEALQSYTYSTGQVQINLKDNNLVAKTIFACDGGNTKWRQGAYIAQTYKKYSTQCLAVLIKYAADNPTYQAYKQHTWQYISATGPKSWLPLAHGYGILCLYYDQKQAQHNLKLENAKLQELIVQELITEKLEHKLADFEILQRVSFPLVYKLVDQYWNNGIVLVGDSAHNIVPMSGQGANLGILDVQNLLENMAKLSSLDSVDLEQTWINYTNQRKLDNELMVKGMDFLHDGYMQKNILLKNIMSPLHLLAGKFSPLNKIIAYYYIGNRSYLSGLNLVRKLFN